MIASLIGSAPLGLYSSNRVYRSKIKKPQWLSTAILEYGVMTVNSDYLPDDFVVTQTGVVSTQGFGCLPGI